MDIPEIKRRLARPATRFSVGGFRPTYAREESWLGRVSLYRPDEDLPVNRAGKTLHPYAQFYLPALPWVSPMLDSVKVLTLFVAWPFPRPEEDMGDNWLIREYRDLDELVEKDLSAPDAFLKPFPLSASLVEEDYPLWDGGGVPRAVEDAVLALEHAGTISCYYDLTTHCYEHKIGGYPSFCQSGIEPLDDYEFVFQISTDDKIQLNVVDNGSLMFWKHKTTGDWFLYYDFY
ncbi:DUF1963 domain-containing protein [uncultured Pseudomonas sp.]|uniref:DUF1963 domain-containing protein n=1 Tax=uncultured Pseudomonas sp. TaxID=114707 RepID=UPI0025EB050B|nr:DUF1963 domain-containing protein [uncultured Pseudomonas sp.]